MKTLKNMLLFGIAALLALAGIGAMGTLLGGCSDQSESRLVRESAESTKADHDLSVVRFKNEVDEDELREIAEFEARSGVKTFFKEGMSFEVSRSVSNQSPTLKVSFVLPLESDINTKRQYYLEVFFLKPKIKAMQLLKFFLNKNHHDTHYQTKSDQWSMTTHCSVAGSELKKSRGVNGEPRSFSCDFGTEALNSQVATYTKKFTSEEKLQIASKKFKSAVLILHEKARVDMGLSSAKAGMWNAYYTLKSDDSIVPNDFPGAIERYPQRYGYRCLLDKGGSDQDSGFARYHRCRYPKSKGGGSS